MSRSLSRRVVFGAVFGSVLVGAFTLIGLRLARPLVHRAVIEYRLNAIDFSKCSASPKSWGWVSGDISLYGYQSSGRSLNPGAPAIEPALLQRAREKEGVAIRSSSGRTVFVIVRNVEGPCSVIRGTTNGPGRAPVKWIVVVLMGAILFGTIFAALGTLFLVVRPLRARIEALSNAARDVGSESFTPESGTSDALGDIANVLAESNTRILQTQATLELRNRALEQHLAEIAHDLRTPLASMHLALESLATNSSEPVQYEAQRALADVMFLSSLVDNLHHGTRLRHEVQVTSGRVDLSDLIRRLEHRFTIVGRHREIQVGANTPEFPVLVGCTPAQAERSEANLNKNEVEHNHRGGHVAIKLGVLDEGERFQLSIADDGPGIPDEILASLQNESFILDEARSRGPGLGNMITQEVARRAGWSIQYTKLMPRGLEVRLEGPVDMST